MVVFTSFYNQPTMPENQKRVIIGKLKLKVQALGLRPIIKGDFSREMFAGMDFDQVKLRILGDMITYMGNGVEFIYFPKDFQNNKVGQLIHQLALENNKTCLYEDENWKNDTNNIPVYLH